MAIVSFFRELGYECSTSRYSSRELDDKKVDIFGVDPFLVQTKAVEKMKKSYHDTIEELPDEKGKYRILIHKKNRRGSIVAMELDTFKELLTMLIHGGYIKPQAAINADAVDLLDACGGSFKP